MKEDKTVTKADDAGGNSFLHQVDKLIGVLASLKFVIGILVIIAVACITGTLLPQGGDVAKFLQKYPGAKGLMDLLSAVGLTHVFSSWWFTALLCLLSASLAVCTFRRFSAAARAKGRVRGRVIGSIFSHVSFLLILAGGMVRGIWGERGYLEFREGETRNYFEVENGRRDLPFSLQLVKFETEIYGPSMERLIAHIPGAGFESVLPVILNVEQVVAPAEGSSMPENAFRVTVLKRIPDFVIDMTTGEVKSRSDEPENPAILVETVSHDGTYTNRQWLFARHPDFNMHATDNQAGAGTVLELTYQVQHQAEKRAAVKDWKSTLKVLDGGIAVMEKTIEVNLPLSYGGYTFYQSGYDPRDPLWTSLQVVRDPGVPLVYTGFVLMIAGLFMVFYVFPGSRIAAPRIAAPREVTKVS